MAVDAADLLFRWSLDENRKGRLLMKPDLKPPPVPGPAMLMRELYGRPSVTRR